MSLSHADVSLSFSLPPKNKHNLKKKKKEKKELLRLNIGLWRCLVFQFGTSEILSSVGLQRAALSPKRDNRGPMQQRWVGTVLCLSHQGVSGPQKLSSKDIQRNTPGSSTKREVMKE